MKMKSLFAIGIMLVMAAQSSAQTAAVRAAHFNVSKNIAIQGYDPVSYFNGKPEEGKTEYNWKYNGITYLFKSQANQARFKENPDHYEPVYGGWCAYAMGEKGEKVKIDPETFKILDGKLYLFYNFWGNNTLTTWNKNEKSLKDVADRNWKKIIQ